MALAKQAIDVNATSATNLALQAYCQARLGESVSALSLIGRAAELAPGDNEVLFERAVVLILAKRPCESLASLKTAIEKGYSVSLAARDDDLRALGGHPEYERLLGVTRTTKGQWATVSCS